MLFYFVVLV